MEATKELCFLCCEALRNKVVGANENLVSKAIATDSPVKCPLFVTWTIGKGHELRGCIGNFGDLPLYKGLQEYAVIAGVHDDRFPPIRTAELPNLQCHISLLHSFEDASDVFDWEIGTHGIILKIQGREATFLPEVAKEENWSKEETLSYLARKAGFRGALSPATLQSAKLRRYQSAQCGVTWQEYEEFRAHQA